MSIVLTAVIVPGPRETVLVPGIIRPVHRAAHGEVPVLPPRLGDRQGVRLVLPVERPAAEFLVVNAEVHHVVAVKANLGRQRDHADDLVVVAVDFDHHRHHIADPAAGVPSPLVIHLLIVAVLVNLVLGYLTKVSRCHIHGGLHRLRQAGNKTKHSRPGAPMQAECPHEPSPDPPSQPAVRSLGSSSPPASAVPARIAAAAT